MPYRTRSRLAGIIALGLAICTGIGSARAEGLELPVPKVTIYPGDAITADLLGSKAFGPSAEALPVVRSPEAAIGKVARRTLLPGKPIPLIFLRDAELIKQGKPVRIVFSEGPLTISGVAVALQSGGLGDLLALRNIDSGTVIKGIVQEDGSVRIAGP
jgi:flagellar basal body P-ring formation protein FlgA